MNDREPNPTDPPLPAAYSDLLGAAAAVAARAVERLHNLQDQFPAALPAPVVAQFDRAHADPAAERRVAVRLPGGPDDVLVGTDGAAAAGAVFDRSPGGLALRLGVFLLPGTVVAVRLPGAGAGSWLPVQVRHTRPDRGAWVVGCAFVTDRRGA